MIAMGLAVALIVYLLRGRALERRLTMLDAIADLSQRVAQLEDSIHANATAPLERKLDLLTQRLKETEAAAAAAAVSSARGVREAPEDETPEEYICKTLGTQGYRQIRIISESELLNGQRELRVEASREGLIVKGSVFLTNGRLGETKLTPIYELFP